MSTLEKAIHIAVSAHQGMLDKAGAPYILHPLRVMLQMDTPEEMTAAVLHDVVEDSDITIAQLREEGFSENVIEAVDGVTRRHKESYENFIRRAAQNPLSHKIKRADLKDNLDLSRLSKITDKDAKRIQKYHQALSLLESEAPGPALKAHKPFTLYLGDV